MTVRCIYSGFCQCSCCQGRSRLYLTVSSCPAADSKCWPDWGAQSGPCNEQVLPERLAGSSLSLPQEPDSWPKGDWERQKASWQPGPWAWTWFPSGPKSQGCSFHCTLLWWLRVKGVPLLSRPAPPLHVRVPLAIKVSVSAVPNGYASAMSRT